MAERQEQIARKRKSNNLKLKIVFLILLILVVAAGAVIIYAMDFVKDKVNKVEQIDIVRTDLDIDPQVAEDLKDYRNILLLGIDTRDVSNNEGSRSDAIIIASINKNTDEIKLASVYRDTYLDITAVSGFDKVTHAHAYGGATETIKTLNRNMDLNIQEVVVVNWGSVADTVDALGGLEVNVKENEIQQMNQYIYDTINTLGGETGEITAPGKQTLDGIQAVTYARIRKGESGGDTARAERMQKLLKAAFAKAKEQNIAELNKIADDILPTIKTNISSNDMMSMLLRLTSYEVSDSIGWPFDYDGWMNEGVWYAPPITLESNVSELHEKLFGQKNYKPTDTVLEYSRQISEATGWYEPVSDTETEDAE